MVMAVELTPVRPVAEKLSVRLPAVPVIESPVKLATPVAVVVAVSVPPNVPPPVAIAAVTTTPLWLTALPLASRTWITGCWANAAPLGTVAEGCVVTVSWVAAPAVIVTAVELTLVRPVAEKLSVRLPAVPVIARLVKAATPVPLVVAVSVPPNVPPPVAIAAVTTTPAWLTALPAASRTWITGCWANAVPLSAVAEGWVVTVSWVAAPAVMVMAVELTPVRPVAERLSVRSPAVPLIARLVKDATPVPLVVAVSVPPNVTPPVPITAVTTTPLWLTALPAASRTWITGCWANAAPLGAVAEGCVVTVSWVAAPAVIVMAVELTPVRPVAEKLSVRSPAVPLIARLVKAATPVPLVVAVSVPPNVTPPVPITAVTTTPLWLTALPAASRTWITGCWANAAPLGAVAEGCVVTVSWVAAPAVIVMAVELTPVRPVAEKLSVRSPAVPLIARLVKAATPVPLV